jgi:ribulose-phosphate 3-epimerase
MTVNPGFGHQQFIRTTVPKIARVRELVDRLKPACEVEVDGGIDAATAPLVVRAGASVLVAGSAIFGDREGVTAAMARLQTVMVRPENECDRAESNALQAATRAALGF